MCFAESEEAFPRQTDTLWNSGVFQILFCFVFCLVMKTNAQVWLVEMSSLTECM